MQPNFQKFLSRKHSVLTDDIIVRAWTDKKRFKTAAGFDNYVSNLKIIDGDFCFDSNWFNEIIDKYSKTQPSFFLKFINKGYKHGEKLKKFVRGINLENKNQVELIKFFWQSIDLLQNLLVFLPETHPLAKTIEQRVILILKNKGIKDGELNEILMKISSPKKKNTPVLEQENLIKIKKITKQSPEKLNGLLSDHSDKFSFLGYREPFSRGYDVKFFKQRLKEINNDDKKLDNKIELSFNKKERERIGLLQELVYFRNYRTEKLYEALYYLEPLWLEINKSLGLSSKAIGQYLLNEIEDLFNNKHKIKSSILNERKAGHGFVIFNGQINFICGQELIEEKDFSTEAVKMTSEIKGMVACKGMTKGTVKIVLRASEQSKIKTDDILVTAMTTPDFLPSMKRAAAFITDEGGITCHAAIIAREMDKPCIIGTKIATKVLKDGDVVEVDANKGIVKIIK